MADEQIFGGKASELETSGPVQKRDFYLPHPQLAPPLGVMQSEFRRDLWQHETKVPGLSLFIVILRLAVWYNSDL